MNCNGFNNGAFPGLARSLRNVTAKVMLGLLVPLCGPVMAVDVLDDDGNRVQLEQAAERIISLAPSLTEVLFAAGAGNKVVGVVDYSDYPPAAQSIQVVGRHDLLDLETILGLRPDLVVAWKTGNPARAIERLKALGIAVYVAEPKALRSIPTHLERLATLAGTRDQAAPVIEAMTATLERLQNTYSRRQEVPVFYQIWDAPLMTAGGNELINDMIELCGGRNIFGDLNLMSPKVDREAVLARNPAVIIASGMDVARPEWLDSWLDWPGLDAVANSHLYFIPPDLVQRHTPRALLGVEQMCEQIDRAR